MLWTSLYHYLLQVASEDSSSSYGAVITQYEAIHRLW